MQNKIFAYLALATGAILSIPLMAMKFQWLKPDPANPADQGVNWELSDFVVMGVLLFGAGSLFVLLARVAPQKYRMLIACAVLATLLITWIHLAVGIVDSWPLAGS